MSGGYFDVNDILAGDERVKCTFATEAIECAYLDPSCVGDDLPSGAVVELPLWLAEPLAARGDVTLELPHFLNARFRRLLKAGPAAVNLRDCSPFFYEIGRHLVPLVDDASAREIEEIMRLAFGGERYRDVLNNAMNSLDEDTTEFTRRLTEEEKALFQAGLRDASDFIQWKGRHAEVITASAVVQRSSKRRKY
ncbi:hypothetical protein PybrP1_010301 [[Pythium] brassicae (nom. inval.)]|nr:hypothetical protein PybrP1_010301 [[Pythium] brassicae (nom. inval.)]